MLVDKNSLVGKAAGQSRDICSHKIDALQIEERDFEYSKTKRGDVWVHRHCWIKLYGGKEK